MSSEIMLSRITTNVNRNFGKFDSKAPLEKLGFQIIGVDNNFYRVRIPNGWSFDSDMTSITVKDTSGKARVVQMGKIMPTLIID